MTELYDIISISIIAVALVILTIHQRLAMHERKRREQEHLTRTMRRGQ